jgi:hypothetical protein
MDRMFILAEVDKTFINGRDILTQFCTGRDLALMLFMSKPESLTFDQL